MYVLSLPNQDTGLHIPCGGYAYALAFDLFVPMGQYVPAQSKIGLDVSLRSAYLSCSLVTALT